MTLSELLKKFDEEYSFGENMVKRELKAFITTNFTEMVEDLRLKAQKDILQEAMERMARNGGSASFNNEQRLLHDGWNQAKAELDKRINDLLT